MISFIERGYQLECNGHILEAIEQYEAALSMGPIPTVSWLRLLFLYALLADDGTAWSYGITSEQIRSYESRTQEIMKRALSDLTNDLEIVATVLLMRSVFLNELSLRDVSLSVFPTSCSVPTASLLRYFTTTEGDLSPKDTQVLRCFLELLSSDCSQRAKYIREVVHLM